MARPEPEDRSPLANRLGVLLAVALGVTLELLLVWFERHHGVAVNGDEGSYLVQAQAFLHGHAHVAGTYQNDINHGRFVGIAPHTPFLASNLSGSFPGPHGRISAFEPGMGLLMAVPAGLGGFTGGRVGLVILQVAGLVYLHRRASSLFGLRRGAQVALGLALAGPALIVAATQVFPDLVSGVALACGLIELAVVERTRRVSPRSAVVIAGAAAVLPWLQVKGVAPAAALLAGLAAVVLLRRLPRRIIVAVAGPAIATWVVLAAYNEHYFGHLSGLPEPPLRFDRLGLEYGFGLLFDRSHGLVVQAPVVLIGIAGLWLARRWVPVAAAATVVGVGIVLVLNAAYVSNPYGGGSFVGRFDWTALPVLAVWAAPWLNRIQAARRGPGLVIAGLTVLGVWQAVPVLAGHHQWYDLAVAAGQPPNPYLATHAYPGWWPGVDRLLPELIVAGRTAGSPAWALPLAAVVALAVILVAVRISPRPGPRSSPRPAPPI